MKEVIKLVSMYRTKVLNFIERKSEAKIITKLESSEVSSYTIATKEIVLTNTSNFSKFHEFGHDIFHSIKYEKKISINDMYRILFEYRIDNEKDLEIYLDMIKEEYKVDINGLTPLSDALCGIMECSIAKFRCHKANYYSKFSSLLFEEFFSNVCAILGTNNFYSIKMLQEQTPHMFNNCLDILDIAMRTIQNKTI